MTIMNSGIEQTRQRLFLTDGGIETTLIFQEGFDLPYFAAFDLLKNRNGREALKRYYEPYAALAVSSKTGFILESPTWRASSDWASKIGYSREQLADANKEAITILKEIREEYQVPTSPFLISGCIGPRGDGYQVDKVMTPNESLEYHREQIETLSQCTIDMITAVTMTYPDEAIGIVNAARHAGLPVVISFTTETDGRLPDGTSLQDAIETVDYVTGNGPQYYMINCAHPDHFKQALEENASWVQRIQGVRANASRKSHAELDEAEELDSGNPEEFGMLYRELRQLYPQFNILGGCCGTDHRHINHVSTHCVH